ncbi:hypothetical protein Ahy_A07g036595 [Arachis hypogaea]|uniref:Uncharacterized protein n=1 Tax=Arachis hypogaea TaxID=3818 RepID=A0A445CGM2_ARAHY|nr:hypothetical protein Ahy_A07g036595 [Arachis hypogaea]
MKRLRADMDIVKIYETVVKNGNRIGLYTEHPVDIPVIVEEKITPTKMRLKTCAKKILTPKKTLKRRLVVVEDDDDAEIVGYVQTFMEAHNKGQAQNKKEAHEATKRTHPTGQLFIPNPNLEKPPSFYIPVDDEDYSDKNVGYHCYESKELRSIASDEDADQPPVFSQCNTDAPVRQIQFELGMEFETPNQFRKAVRKFNINLGRSIFFPHCDSTRSKAICYDEGTAMQEMYEANHKFCAIHIWQNFRKKWNDKQMRMCIWACAKATATQDFNFTMEKLKKINVQVWEYLDKLAPKQWSRAHFIEYPKMDNYINNNYEVFNAKIDKFREKLIITMLEEVRCYVMRIIAKNKKALI